MKALSVVVLMGLLASVAFAAKETKKEEKAKTYSEAEFHEAVMKAVSEKLKKVNGNKVVDFSTELLERERQLEVKEQEIKKREATFTQMNEDFAKQIKEFGQKQSSFLACLDETEQKEKNRLTHMVDVISGMKPANAAEVLSVQEASISVKILGELEPVKVSKIFNLMDKEISARLQKQYLTMKK